MKARAPCPEAGVAGEAGGNVEDPEAFRDVDDELPALLGGGVLDDDAEIDGGTFEVVDVLKVVEVVLVEVEVLDVVDVVDVVLVVVEEVVLVVVGVVVDVVEVEVVLLVVGLVVVGAEHGPLDIFPAYQIWVLSWPGGGVCRDTKSICQQVEGRLTVHGATSDEDA